MSLEHILLDNCPRPSPRQSSPIDPNPNPNLTQTRLTQTLPYPNPNLTLTPNQTFSGWGKIVGGGGNYPNSTNYNYKSVENRKVDRYN